MRNLLKIARFYVLSIFLTGFIIFVTYGEEPLNNLKKITYQRVDKKLEVIVEIEGEFEHDVFELYVPPRLVIDIWKIQKIGVEPELKVNEGNVLRIRVGEYQPCLLYTSPSPRD